MNETERFPDESESSRICSGNILGPAEHSSRKGIFVGAQSLVTDNTKSLLSEYLSKNSLRPSKADTSA